MRGIDTKTKASFADIISFCNDTKSERGNSPMACNDINMETISLRSRSPASFKNEQNWSPRYNESKDRNGFSMLDVVEKGWKVNLRSKIESDLTNQVQQALAPIVSKTNAKKWTEKKKTERQKNYHMINFGGGLRQGHVTNSRIPVESSGGGGGNFKYIDVNYISQNRLLTGADPIYGRDLVSRSLSNLRLPKRNGLHSQAMYGLEDIARSHKQAANMRGGLDVTLLDANDSSMNFLGLPNKHGAGNTLRPLIPNVIAYNGLSLPNYGATRRCFQTYTKEGMNSLLNSRTRRGKLTHMGHGKYVDKRGVIISRLGPFWPQGYGPVCQCPIFNQSCPAHENLNPDSSSDEASRMIDQELSSQKQSQVGFLKQSSRINGKDERPVVQRVNFRSRDLSYLDNDTNKHYHQNQRTNHNSSGTTHTSTTTNNINNNNNNNTTGNNNNIPTAKPLLWRGKPVIFDCERSSRSPLPHSVPEGFDESLVFESRFESGNLRQVRRTGAFEYELVLRTDMYTNRHTQWYYFRMQKAKKDRVYKFNIINFLKKNSLYNYGMKPLLYSENLAVEEGRGWHRSGENIKYSSWSNPTRNAILSLDLQYFCLEYEVKLDWDSVETDTIYMAHCYPYTYSDLRRHLDEVMKVPDVAKHVKKEVLCETTAGNACFLLTITDFPDKEKDKYKDFHMEKKGVVITARVHPGETQASWMMKGVIDFLTSDSPSAIALRQKFVFKIVPMLNPDGVIVGNYRTSLAARDLNRNYRHPRQGSFPTIWHTKQMVDQFNKDHPILLYCDLHGHSRKHMVFMYGCDRRSLLPKNGAKSDATRDPLADARDFVEERLFPWLLFKLAPTRFSFNSTKFSVRRSKESTGRVVMFKQMKILNSFTMEASFSGTQISKDKGRHFNIKDFQLIGRKLCECVLEYSRISEDPTAKSRAVLEMTHEVAKRLISTQKIPPTDVNLQSLTVKSSNQTNNESVAKKTPSSAPPAQSNNATKTGQQPKAYNKQTAVTSKTEQGNSDSNIANLSSNNEARAETNDDVTDVFDDITEEDDPISCGPIADQVEEEEKKVPDLNEDCLRMLQRLNVREAQLESETSSESNSDTDPEEPVDMRGSKSKLRGSQEGSGRKKKKKKRQQKFGKSISAPSIIQPSHHSNRMASEENNKDIAAKNVKTNYPGYVNKYAHRSNGGIPIFAQERIKQRAARRLAELKVAEEDRKQQEEDLREQLLLSGIQDGPNIPVSSETTEGYSNICGIRYKVGSQPRRVHYMLYNPYRDQSPSKDKRPLLTMRFSPPSQKHNTDDVAQCKTVEMEGMVPYRVQAPAGRLSNQRRLGSLAELSGTSSEPTSSQSSYQHDLINDNDVSNDESKNQDDVELVSVNENEDIDKFNPRSVVVPIKNLSFKGAKKTTWAQRPTYVTCVPRPGQGFPDRDLNSPDSNPSHGDKIRRSNVPELFLPPNMEVSDVMTAHMRYPTQVHRVDVVKPRVKSFSRGPPMVFGEPVVMNQKVNEISVLNQTQNTSSHQLSQFLLHSGSMPCIEQSDDAPRVANVNLTQHSTTYDERYGLTNHGRESAWANQIQVNFNVGVTSEAEENVPLSGNYSDRDSKENNCDDVISDSKSERYPFTVR